MFKKYIYALSLSIKNYDISVEYCRVSWAMLLDLYWRQGKEVKHFKYQSYL